ncbi:MULTISPECIES: D-alanine--D-alanine ligase [unclassified Lentimicrobium]|uniref:D-alanine--D-alanine ligase n=1 Tax=unclassified Lentimicrobium TaxID=2677434 RepID=UPI0015542150|nr:MULTISPECIES: D-alanine--D-alanine ligase [unclassified Lentimicrobium]NPD44689.1 D-alanine--D-alanine ligase [Lentimicrobium sp. S6]NPD83455.1 D-alanine--D-alanine ligase [Lentimicrobium sp. L6]
MKKVALIAGGDSGEYEISIKSASIVAQNIPSEKYEVYLIEIKGSDWIYRHESLGKINIDKNDFSLTINDKKISFDVVFNAIHGTPGEDGKILAFLEMLKIPFTSTGSISSALTFNKAFCNQVVKNAGFNVANSMHLFKEQTYTTKDILTNITLPCFVKPNQGGSSVGMSKVKTEDEILPALKKAFAEDTEVLVEEFIEGRELTIGTIKLNDEIITFPITEIISKKEFFDFEAKYNPELNQEITPAQIPISLKQQIEEVSTKLYQVLHLRGVVRFDYINSLNGLYFLEVNTVPGLSAESLIPQQIREFGSSTREIFDLMIQEALRIEL